jgi:parallel beta-helix repeat protein
MIARSAKFGLFVFFVAALILPVSADAQPVLSVSPTSFDLKANVGANVPTQTVQVRNAGNKALKWSIVAPTAPWMTVSPTSGVNSSPINLTFRTSSLAAGAYQTSFNVVANTGSSLTVTVLVNILAPAAPAPEPTPDPVPTPDPTPTDPDPTLDATLTSGTDFRSIMTGIRPRGVGSVTYFLSQPTSGRRVYYVATTGSDTNPGSSTAPLRTINKAAQLALAGDVVTIRNGTYQESVFVRNSGTSTAPIVFQAESRGGVILTGGKYFFQPAAWTGGKLLSGQFYITLKGLIFRAYSDPYSTASQSAAVRAVRGWRIENCLFDRAGQNAVVVVDDFITITNSTLQYNYVHAIVAFGRGNGATSPTDSRFIGINGFRLIDSVIRGNYTSASTLDGRTSSSVMKIMGSKGVVIDNIESYENNGPGVWFDADNFNYIVRNSYFHNNYSNPGVSPGRGIHLELSWGPGLVENNVIMNNAAEGIAVSNSWGIEIRNNLVVGNRECARLSDWVSRSGSVNQYVLHDVNIHHNKFKDWFQNSCINPYGDRPLGMAKTVGAVTYSRLTIDYNIYQPVRNPNLTGWWGDKGFLTTITQLRGIKTEMNGAIGSITW